MLNTSKVNSNSHYCSSKNLCIIKHKVLKSNNNIFKVPYAFIVQFIDRSFYS